MGPSNCAVVRCTNNRRKLNKWKNEDCPIHVGLKQKFCGCPQPFRLFCFPGPVLYKQQRERWIKALRRQTVDKKEWNPCPSDRVCSLHFVNGEPTPENPDPVYQLGYEKIVTTPRRELFRHPLNKKRKRAEESNEGESLLFEADTSHLHHNQIYFNYEHDSTPEGKQRCLACKDKNDVIFSMAQKIAKLSLENRRLRKSRPLGKLTFSWTYIKTDKKMNFYTGIPSVRCFNVLFSLIQLSLPKVKYWRGNKILSKKIGSISSTSVISQEET